MMWNIFHITGAWQGNPADFFDASLNELFIQ